MKTYFFKFAKQLYLALLAIGFDARVILSYRHFFKYKSQYNEYLRMGGAVTHRNPVFTDYDEQAGSTFSHYFHQDLLVSSFVYIQNPKRHIDIGSRIDGFVAHVASFRKIEVLDVRDLPNTGHLNISFIKADLMDAANAADCICDSVSCLHAIEHFGLGR